MIPKKFLFLCLLPTLPTLANYQDNVGWELGLRLGYRQDDAHYKTFDQLLPTQDSIQEPFLFKESFHCNSPQFEAFTTFRFSWFEIEIDADWASVVGGTVRSQSWLTEHLIAPNTCLVPVTFHSTPKGDLWDAFGTARFFFPYYGEKCLNLSLLANGGYSIHHQSLKRKHLCPKSLSLGSFAFLGEISSSTTITPHYGSRFKRTYQGPFFGASLQLGASCFEGEVGYTYHWLSLCQSFRIKSTLDLFINNPPELLTRSLTDQVKFTSSYSKGNRGWLHLLYRGSNCWKIGLRGTYFRVDTPKKERGRLKEKEVISTPEDISTIVTNKKISLNGVWQTFSILAQFSYDF